MPMKKANLRRARTAHDAIKKYCTTPGEIFEENIIDILTDLRHLCDREDFNFTRANEIAARHYQVERN